MVFWKKEQDVESMFDRYIEACDACFQHFDEAMTALLESGQSATFEDAVVHIHRMESEADTRRRSIEHTLYSKALLPESRGDLLGLLETYDKLPNIAETIAFAFSCQAATIPEELNANFRELVAINLEAYGLARGAVHALFKKPTDVPEATVAIEEVESRSDDAERKMIRSIFASSRDTGDKILLREYVQLIGEISDRAERLADRVGITAIKRQI
jgi:uncharacterized protein